VLVSRWKRRVLAATVGLTNFDWEEFAPDSPLEETGFELLVPPRVARSRKDLRRLVGFDGGSGYGGMSGRFGGLYFASSVQPARTEQSASSVDIPTMRSSPMVIRQPRAARSVISPSSYFVQHLALDAGAPVLDQWPRPAAHWIGGRRRHRCDIGKCLLAVSFARNPHVRTATARIRTDD
jgi:hypothetical protein